MNLGRLLWAFAGLFIFALVLGYSLGLLFSVPQGNLAVIKINGVISSSDYSVLLHSPTVNGQDIIDLLSEAEANPLIQGVLLDINSPGGSAVPSALITEAVRNLSKPVVAYIRDSGTSGAYMIASAADEVWSHNFSIIGSIGVSLNPYVEFSGLMSDYNVTYINLSYPEHKDIGSPYREITDEEYDSLINKLKVMHKSFTQLVSVNRNMTLDELRVLADGSFYTGVEGLSNGLIDRLGSFSDAKARIANLSGVTEPQFITLTTKQSIFDFLTQLRNDNKLLMIDNVKVIT